MCVYIYMYYIHPTAKRIMNDVVPMDPGGMIWGKLCAFRKVVFGSIGFFSPPFSLAASQYVGSCPRSSWCYSLHAITCRCLLKRSSGRRGTTGTTGTAGTAGTAGTTGTAGNRRLR